jgi:hypothetical protein
VIKLNEPYVVEAHAVFDGRSEVTSWRLVVLTAAHVYVGTAYVDEPTPTRQTVELAARGVLALNLTFDKHVGLGTDVDDVELDLRLPRWADEEEP